MNRRDFFALTSAAIVSVPAVAWSKQLEYKNGLVAKRLAKGETLFLDYNATWCTTCAAQGRVIDALRANNPAYDKAITFVNVDWDTYKNQPITLKNNIPRRSTLIVLKGDAELGRIVAGTSKRQIGKLMDLALSSANS